MCVHIVKIFIFSQCHIHFMHSQRWARAYRDGEYHAAVNTNNGVEAQNKLLKYRFLPRSKQKATLSSTLTILIERYLPTCKQKYLFQNYRQSPQYRTYKNFVPTYLHNRPRSVILHCLDRKTRSVKFLAPAIQDINTERGVFEVSKNSTSKQTVDFGRGESSDMPSCTCKDWQQYHIPCKHFFAVFQHRSEWQWEQLPETYLNSAYLTVDRDALDKHFSQLPTPQDREDESLPESESVCHEPEGEKITEDLPRPVSINNYTSMHRNLCNLLCTAHRAPQSLTDMPVNRCG